MVKYAYTLGASGERLQVEELDRTVVYEYDALYRLMKETITTDSSTSVTAYTYDAVGNRLTKTVDGTVTNYTYNALNQLLTEDDITYTYDINGNLVTKESPAENVTYSYDLNNRLIKAEIQTGNNTITEEYAYDWAGNRIEKTVDGDVTKYVIDINDWISHVVAELDSNDNLKTFYTRDDDLISLHRTDETRYYIYDGHGSVRMLTDESGDITDTYTFDAFGNIINQTGTTENNYLYAGEQFDSNTGFYYLRARYMDPSVGRFISMDEYQGSIFDPVSLHKYLYANANPVTYTDPTGYFSLGEMSAASTIRGVVNGIAVGGISGALLNSLITFAQGEEMTTRVIWDGFWQGALFGGSFAGMSMLASKYLFASMVLVSAHTWSTYSGISDGIDEFKDGNIMLSMVLIGSSLGGGKGKPGKGISLKTQVNGQTLKLTNRQVRDLAKHLDFKEVKGQKVKGELVFTDGKTFITQGNTSHIGGVWKQAKTIKNLGSNKTRMGTYDALLNKIGK